MPETSSTLTNPVAAQYVATFLKGEMLHLYRQIRALRAFRAVVFCQKRENPIAFPFEDVVRQPKPRTHQLRRLWQKTILRRPITLYRSEAEQLLAAMRQRGTEVLQVYFGHIGVHLLPLLERATFPTLVSFHGADAQVDHDNAAFAQSLRRVFAVSTLILVRSASIQQRLVEAGCSPGKIRLHRTGLPLAEIQHLPRTFPQNGVWHIVQASRLIRKKGLFTTLAAFGQFAQRFPHAMLTLAGEGPLLPELRQRAAELGLAGRVRFPGFLGQPALMELYRSAHLFVHPSELGPDGDQEGVPNAMLEAMATGLPVVATKHGGIPEAVEHEATGLLVAERDAEGLAQAMLRLAENEALWATLGAAGVASVQANFDLEAQARVLEGHYREAIALWKRAFASGQGG